MVLRQSKDSLSSRYTGRSLRREVCVVHCCNRQPGTVSCKNDLLLLLQVAENILLLSQEHKNLYHIVVG